MHLDKLSPAKPNHKTYFFTTNIAVALVAILIWLGMG